MSSRLLVAVLLGFALSIAACLNCPAHVSAAQADASSINAADDIVSDESGAMASQAVEALESDEFGASEIAATTVWAESLHLADWLGPLAPLALSPFFGITCLSGLAIWGPDWITDNALLGAAGPLKNPTLFFVFLGFTVLTSVPRLTKVSKPFAQAVDRIETYSVIVILLIVKVIASLETSDVAETPVAVIQLGVLSFSANTLLAIAMVVNVLVINSVKFFFEFLVWLTPIPALDACFEVMNKTLCAGLMALYAMSPTLATVVNLVLLVTAAFVLRWISRRVRFYRTMILDPILASFWQDFGTPKRPELIVFPREPIGPFAAKSRLVMRRAADGNGWELHEANWWRRRQSHVLPADVTPTLRRGWVMHAVEVRSTSGTSVSFCFSRRFDSHLEKLAEQLNVRIDELDHERSSTRDHGRVASEFA